MTAHPSAARVRAAIQAFAPPLRDRLADRGIKLQAYGMGEHRGRCPECRRPPSKPDHALAVLIDDDGATWTCHRCGWQGGARDHHRDAHHRGHRVDHRDRAEPEQHKTLSPWGHELWTSCRPIGPGTVAARYLERRGCTLPPADGDLRWHAALKHPSGHVGPALVALVTHVERCEPLILHRTWIAPDGTKVPIERPRLLLKGHTKASGVIRLWPDEEITLGLAIAEGIETALVAARGFGLAWATIDAGNLGNLPVLPGIEALTIVADHDEAGLRAAEACAERWAEAGVEVRIWRAPQPGDDLADWTAR